MVKSKFSIALHIMTILAHNKDQWHTSAFVAGSLNINAVLVRNEIKTLKTGGLIESKEGKNGGVRLAEDANKILLSTIFKIAKGDNHVLGFCSNDPNPNCPIGRQIQTKLDKIFTSVDDAIIESLNDQTLESFKNQF